MEDILPCSDAKEAFSVYRPVAHIMKVLEKLVLAHLRPQLSTSLDRLQDGVDDVIIYLLHQAVSHLDKTGSTVRIMFQQQSSQRMQIDTAITSWIRDYLTGRPQFVQLCRCVSEQVVRSIAGGPSSHLSSSPCTPLTLSTTRSPVICRCIQMTLRLWRVSGLDRKQSTET